MTRLVLIAGNRNGRMTMSRQKPRKIKNKRQGKELKRLQIELVNLQEWIKHKGLRVVALFKGCGAAGKGDTINHRRPSQRGLLERTGVVK